MSIAIIFLSLRAQRSNPVVKRTIHGIASVASLPRNDIYFKHDMKNYYVYIITNQRNTTLYTGVTNDLTRRMHEHKSKLIPGFAKRYNLDKLVFFEQFNDINQALENEKRIKAGSRKKKEELINNINKEWNDLS